MPYNVKFDFSRPLNTRVVDVFYVSPAVCPVLYYSVPTSGDGETVML